MNIEKIKYIILIAFLSLNITDILSSNDNYNINDKVQVIKDDTIVFNNNIYIKHIPDNNDTNLTRYNKHLNTYTSFWSCLIP